MGNSTSRKPRPKPRNSLSKIFKSEPRLGSPNYTVCAEPKKLQVCDLNALSERAYRHHRKRVARIVADQWIYAARYRLLGLRFRKRREWKTKRNCISEWKHMIELRRIKFKTLERALGLCRHLRRMRCFQKWKKCVDTKRKLGNVYDKICGKVRCRQLAMSLGALQRHGQAQVRERCLLAKAQSFHEQLMLRICLSQWLAYARRRVASVAISCKAVEKWRSVRLKLVMGAWRATLVFEKGNHHDKAQQERRINMADAAIQAQAVEIPAACHELALNASLQTKCFWQWYLLASQKMAHTENGNRSLILSERHYERNLQRTAYDGWRQFASQSSLAKSISRQSLELDTMIQCRPHRPQNEVVHVSKPSRRTWDAGKREHLKILGELLQRNYLSRTFCTDLVIKPNNRDRVKGEPKTKKQSRAGSRRVWAIGDKDYAKAKSEILKLMYCSKPSSREIAVSWFVKSLVKRLLCLWRKHVVVVRQTRQNQWYADIHVKMHRLHKGFYALRENVDVKLAKQSMNELSMSCYQETLKRKAVSGCRLIHQAKRVKVLQIEQAAAQWRTARLHKRFERWYFAAALRSMRRGLLQKSVNFWKRQLLIRALQSWRDFKASCKQTGNLKSLHLERLKGSLTAAKKSRILNSWKTLRKEMNIKRLNQAQAVHFFTGLRTAPVVKALHAHVQKQQWKRSRLAKAIHFRNARYRQLGLCTWSEYTLLKDLNRLAAKHRRQRLLRQSMTSLMQWRQPHVDFKDVNESENPSEIENLFRKVHHNCKTVPGSREEPVSKAATRAQPRRPAFLFEEGLQPQVTRIPDRRELFETKRKSTPLNRRDPKLVANEINWMELLLLDYQTLKIKIVELRAELALRVEERTSALKDGADGQNQNFRKPQERTILLLQEELSSLEEKKAVQGPLVHAILSRVQDLRVTIAADEHQD